MTLKLSNISKSFKSGSQTLDVLKDVSLTLRAGESIAITGESGSGKSTLLHIAGFMDKADNGTIHVQDEDVKTEHQRTKMRRHKLGFIFQHHHLQREFSVLENILIPARLAGVKDAHLKANELLVKVGLENRKNHLPSQLSGGERQRVAIARALINSPEFILADEPTGSLDPETAESCMEILFQLIKDQKVGLLLVTHNLDLAKRCKKHFALANGALKKK
jgi:ABC-type lipoprotein export system ATPase subunit